MKNIIAREVLFLFIALVIAIPVAVIFLYLASVEPYSGHMSKDEKVLEMDLLIIGAFIGFLGVYITRLVVWAVKQLIVLAT